MGWKEDALPFLKPHAGGNAPLLEKNVKLRELLPQPLEDEREIICKEA